MNKIDWNTFKVKNENFTKSFEELCYQLFCRKHKFQDGIPADFNQAGLETNPKKSTTVNMMVGFQSKFFEKGTDYSQIKRSIEKALKTFGNDLDEITIFLNSNAKITSDGAKEIVSIAKVHKVKIQWFTESQFQIALNQPCNLDLAQLYFGFGDENNFINSNISTADLSFLQSGGFLPLPIVKLPGRESAELNLKAKLSILTGNPGSGKSVVVKNLFCSYAKLFGKKTVFDKNKILPMLINLKDCYSDSLENLIRERQKDYGVQNKNIKFVYILDGLDELNDLHCELSLRTVKRLSEASNTDKIIISCRRGSLNKVTIHEYFDSYDSYDINELVFKDMECYFYQKGNKEKADHLLKLQQVNSLLIEEITDIFLVKLLWDTIYELSEDTTIIDLLEVKINGLLKETCHRNNLIDLNLLIPKEKAIIRINEKLSYIFSKKYQYRFKHSAISKFLCREFPQLDYEEINKIAGYNLNTFFDKSVGEQNNNTYIYQHRRYQEYFFARRLKKKFEKDIGIIRKTGVILSADFFDDIFMKYLSKEYKKNNDIPSLALLSSIKYYQKSGDHWYINDSAYFIDTLACQREKTLEFLLNDDVLETSQYIYSTYENALKFYEKGKESAAHSVIAHCSEEMFEFDNTSDMKDLEGQLYYKFKILKDVRAPYDSDFLKEYRKFYKNFYDTENSILDSKSPQEFIIKCYFKIGLKHFKKEMAALIEALKEREFCVFLDLLSTLEFLPFFFASTELQESIKEKLKKYRKRAESSNIAVFFFRKLLNINVSAAQILSILNILRPRQAHVREFSFNRQIHPIALSYVIAGEEIFLENRNVETDHTSADDIIKYCVLYHMYCESFSGQTSFAKDLVYYEKRFKKWNEARPRIKLNLTKLWAYLFYNLNGTRSEYLQLKKILTFDFDAFVFLNNLNTIDGERFHKVITQAEILPYENSLKEWKDDYSEFVDRCFMLSSMYSQFNGEKSIHYIKEAFINSKLRHGWRKDIFISEFLNDAFGQILAKNWLTKKEVKAYARSIFSLNIRIFEITDRDHTRYGVLNFLEALSPYDLKLAHEYLKEFKEMRLESHIVNLSVVSLLVEDIKNNALPYEKVSHIINGWQFLEKEYHQARFRVLMEVLGSDFYEDQAKISSFNKAYEIVDSVQGKFSYHKEIIGNYYSLYDRYCQMNGQKNILSTEKESYGEHNEISQSDFSKRIDYITNKKELKDLYDFYSNYNNRIEIVNKDIWEKWIDKTLAIEGNINLFIELTKKQEFLKTGFWGILNSDYFYLGVAYSLENPNTKEAMEDFLNNNGGYASFYKMTYVYCAMNEKDNALDLFKKFYQFCQFLVT
ncbi:NACHT domain-containing protein [Sphingobacterium anhuiense]|uniref:NACHT domain-containing protein n=1 Tax=Sphingobacterium anhuiense TaxID=493780 RepID=A0ABW5YWM4_9SPHI